MYIERFQVTNYCCFADTGEVLLRPGFNLVIGPNNVGKTVLLEALVLGQFRSRPHRTSRQSRSQPINPNSTLDIDLILTGGELKSILLSDGRDFWIRVPGARIQGNGPIEFLSEIFQRDELTFALRNMNGGWSQRGALPPYLANTVYHPLHSAHLRPLADRSGFEVLETAGGTNDSVYLLVLHYHNTSTYRFRAERLNIGSSQIQGPTQLEPNASNLPAVLLQLQSNPARFDRLNRHMTEVFPNVRRISVMPTSASTCEIRVWNIEPCTERDDLAVSLLESGTGLGQVLAMLYIAVTSEAGRTIIIDEPNSFLHPGAARKLIEILKGYRQQYIIATHSADIIGVSEPQTLNLISWDAEESHIQTLNAADVTDIRRALLEVGARLSDVMGADNVLWVEGPTEEVCVPKILGRMSGGLPLGTVVVAVRNTGDLESRRPSAKAIWEVYERLTCAKALLPRTIAFSLDREGRRAEEMAELKQRSNGLVHFLPRRSYENYLLHPQAIIAVLNEQTSFRTASISTAVVEEWLGDHGSDAKYQAPSGWTGDLSDRDWLKEVRAAKLLEDLFVELSDAKEEYRKSTHSVAITEWLLQHDPDHLRELADFLRNVLAGDQQREQRSAD